jgi:hypothetical protein
LSRFAARFSNEPQRRQPEHEICRKTIRIALYGLIEAEAQEFAGTTKPADLKQLHH